MKGFTNKLFFNRSLFRKQLLSYLITVFIPTIMIVSVYAYTINEDLNAQIEQTSNATTQRTTKNLEYLIDQINYLALQLSFLPDMNRMLKDPTSFNLYDYYQLKEQLRTQINSNDLFDSVYLYSALNERLMTSNEGLFDADTFYDQQVITQIRKEGRPHFWYQVRDRYVTFYKDIPVTESKPLGTLVINMEKNMFLTTMYNLNIGDEHRMFIMDGSGYVISTNPEADGEAVHQVLADGEVDASRTMQKIHLDHGTYFAQTASMKGNGWILVNLVPYDSYKAKLLEKLSKLLSVVLVVFLIGVGIAYAFAVKMYNPWKKIVEALTGNGVNKSASDEYQLVSGAISTMMATIKQHEPVMKDHLIADILRNKVSDKGTIAARLAQVGLPFQEPYFAVVVAVFDEMASEDAEDPQHNLLIFSLILETLKSYLPAEGTILDHRKLGFIVNLPNKGMDRHVRELIYACYGDMNTVGQRDLNVSLQLIVSDAEDPERLHLAYEQIRRMLNYKAVINRNDIVFVQDHKNELKFVYPLSLQKQLIHAVSSMNRDKADQCVGELFGQYMYKAKYPLEKLQGMIVILMSSVLNELLKEGHDIGSLNEEADIFKLNECHNNDELYQFMITHIHKIIAFLETQQDKQVTNQYVAKTIAYMETHYASQLSITDIAEHIGVSSGHLSRTFKAETGKSMLEYLTEIRIKKSKELLGARQDALQEIAQAVGYPDVQSYIRFFKKYEGMTPGEYRKSH